MNLIATACRFLARYNLEQGNLDIAYNHAQVSKMIKKLNKINFQRCLNYDISKEEGYRILSLIKSKRKEDQEKMVRQMETTPSNHGQQRTTVSYRTPIDAPRPIGGGDE